MAEDKLRIERGEMPETLLEIMQKEQCDLLVRGHHHSFINRLMPAYRGMIIVECGSLDRAVYRQVTAYQHCPSYAPVGDANVSSSAGVSFSNCCVSRTICGIAAQHHMAGFLYSSAGQPRFSSPLSINGIRPVSLNPQPFPDHRLNAQFPLVAFSSSCIRV